MQQQQYKVSVATLRGRPYYEITHALKQMGVRYDSISPEEAADSSCKVVITTRDEAGMIAARGGGSKAVMLDTELVKYPAIAKAKILRSIAGSQADDQLTIGIDPGNRIGISVMYLHEEIASIVESSPASAIGQISAVLGGVSSHRKVVKIGDGNIRMALSMAWALKKKFHDDVEVEIVDEHGTSRPQNNEVNRRGIRDRMSARTIAFRPGRPYYMQR
ncbi:hypothetical protein [Nitrososphaera viennensis]|uniref:Uncharacterized protein n=1 Tax=Nitrososphaera viennensis TaxID=1034015 RepID=A0A977IBQ5_9ARCH|nr:hypothetical protein [Nitrososphaera viennensis]UVS68049.1 hypothetical protein NWT39_09055 [Nitrososphaera viennensis]